jgi:hypothetical protein
MSRATILFLAGDPARLIAALLDERAPWTR